MSAETLIPLPLAEPIVEPVIMLEKEAALRGILQRLGSIVIGFSGGVDSTLLLSIGKEVLGKEHVLAVIGISETYPERELAAAMRLAELLDVPYRTTRTEETDVLKFKENPPDRCYYCKSELYTKLASIRDEIGFGAIVDGTNGDDTMEFRPGLRALSERDVHSPLAEAHLTKAEIRELSRRRGLSTSEKPSYACLSSRFPYGTGIDREKLKRIDAAENLLYDLGFRIVRVRYHDSRTARLELSPSELARATEPVTRMEIVTGLRKLGFTYITLDLQGFRSGSMNEVLTREEKESYLHPST